MEEIHKHFLNNNRRNFLKKAGLGIGGLALGSMLDPFGTDNNICLLYTSPSPRD